MKVFVIAAFLGACLAACSGSPVAPRLVDWTAVSSKVNEIRDTVTDAGRDIVALAGNENAAVGAAIQTKVEAASLEASAVLDRVNQAIAAQTLTEGQVRALTGELRGIIGKLRGSVEADTALLTPVAAGQIRAVFDGCTNDLTLKSNELAALVRA